MADAAGKFDWAEPDAEVHAYINDLERPVGTYLLGRRMYEVMVYWETADGVPGQRAVSQDYATIWRAAEKVVYSSTLESVSSERTRLERVFDPVGVSQIKLAAALDISVGGPALAAHALRAGLVDELHLFVTPIMVGAGNPALPANLRTTLELLDERRFGCGVVHLHYRVR